MYLFSFYSRTAALKIFDLFIHSEIDAKLINTPRAITRDCALSVSVSADEFDRAKSRLSANDLKQISGIYFMRGMNYVKIDL